MFWILFKTLLYLLFFFIINLSLGWFDCIYCLYPMVNILEVKNVGSSLIPHTQRNGFQFLVKLNGMWDYIGNFSFCLENNFTSGFSLGKLLQSCSFLYMFLPICHGSEIRFSMCSVSITRTRSLKIIREICYFAV